jgi:hypothetical protein
VPQGDWSPLWHFPANKTSCQPPQGKEFYEKMREKGDMHRIEGEYDNHEIYIQKDALFVFDHSFADRNDCLCQA